MSNAMGTSGYYENDAAEGSLEWHGWGEGYDYAARTGGVHQYPLSGEWADMPSDSDVVYLAWLHLALGDTRTEFEADRREGIVSDDEYDDTLDSFEHGYYAWQEDNGKIH